MFSLLDESITKKLVYNNKTTNMNDIHLLLKYFDEIFITIDKPSSNEEESITIENLRLALSEHITNTYSPIRVILFIIYARLLQYECRLVFAADLPPMRPPTEKDLKLNTSEKESKRTRKKKTSTLSDDENSNSMISQDTSLVNSTELVKNHQAISPTPTTTVNSTEPKVKTSSLKPRYYWVELFIEGINDGFTPIDVYTSKINCLTDFEVNVKFPMLYVWAFDTDLSSSYAKEVTKRYSQKWLNASYRKSHIEHKTNGDRKWYAKLMKKYQPKDERKSEYSQVENKQIEGVLIF